MLGVLAQRLCKRICTQCKEAYHPSIHEYEDLVDDYGVQNWERHGSIYNDQFILYRGRGCDACNRTGFRGRVSLHELLIASEEIKQLILTKARTTEMLTKARESGMITLLQDGILKVLQGLTTYRQVRAVAMK
jgi:type II secretory ATPase GspE/PulE/Tfp pilus assembly ATPase PilB-like protein